MGETVKSSHVEDFIILLSNIDRTSRHNTSKIQKHGKHYELNTFLTKGKE